MCRQREESLKHSILPIREELSVSTALLGLMFHALQCPTVLLTGSARFAFLTQLELFPHMLLPSFQTCHRNTRTISCLVDVRGCLAEVVMCFGVDRPCASSRRRQVQQTLDIDASEVPREFVSDDFWARSGKQVWHYNISVSYLVVIRLICFHRETPSDYRRVI